MTEPVTTDAGPTGTANKRVRRPRRGVIAFLILGFVVLAIAFPVTAAVLLDEAPYLQIFVSYPGADVAVTTTVLLACSQMASLVGVGAMVHLLFLRDSPARRARYLPQGFEIRVLRIASGTWAACAGALVVFEALDANGAPLDRLGIGYALPFLWEASDAPKAWTISLVAAMIVLFASFFADTWTGLLIPLWVSAIGVLAPVVTGQVLVGPDHDFGGDAAVFQTVAVHTFFGALAVSGLRVASGRFVAPETLRRLFLVGAVALPVIIVTDIVIGLFKLAGSPIVASLTGWLIMIGGTCLLVATGALASGWWLGRRARLRAGSVSGFSHGGYRGHGGVGRCGRRDDAAASAAVLRADQYRAGVHGLRGPRRPHPRRAVRSMAPQPPSFRDRRSGDHRLPGRGARPAPAR